MSYKDYRYQDYQAITQGNAVIAAGATQYDTERVLSFPLPNVTSMCLDVAYTTWVESQHFLRDEKFLEFPKPLTPETTIRQQRTKFFLIFSKREWLQSFLPILPWSHLQMKVFPTILFLEAKGRIKNVLKSTPKNRQKD